MLFPTFEFGLFFLAVYVVAWLARDRLTVRKLFLLATSYFFYAQWDWRFTGLLAFSSALNYLGGLGLNRFDAPRTRKAIMLAVVAANLVVLGFFKYYGFFIDSLTDLFVAWGIRRDLPILEIILPVGISFFTFQGISYVVDVYRGQIKHPVSLLDLFLFISFFPQLVAGPIVRAAHFLPQLRRKSTLDGETLAYGLVLIVSGLFKKTVVAHYIATDLVDPVFLDPASHTTLDLIGAQYAYAVQVYLDFSAYSDIAIGIAALLGFRFRKNFDRPFGSTSLAQLWQRWHISLSTFLRDYLYRALRGERRESTLMTYRNIFLTMLLGGLWHGAAWTFIIWGAIHGLALVAERHFKRVSGTFRKALSPWLGALFGWLFAFHVFTLAAIFFRSPNIGIAADYFASLARFRPGVDFLTPFNAALIVACVAVHFLPGDALNRVAERLRPLPVAALGLLFGLGILASEAIGPEGVAPFIYYQF